MNILEFIQSVAVTTRVGPIATSPVLYFAYLDAGSQCDPYIGWRRTPALWRSEKYMLSSCSVVPCVAIAYALLRNVDVLL